MVHVENNRERAPFEHYARRFAGLDPVEAAGRCGVRWEPGSRRFTLRLLQADYRIAWPDFAIEAEAPDALALHSPPAQVLLQRYLLEGRASPPSTRFLTFRELPWGEVYARPFEGRCVARAARTFGGDLPAFRRAAESLRGLPIRGGDAAFQLEFMPGYDLRLILWEGDEEFPPSAQILFSDNFPLAFSAEDRTVAGDLVISELKRRM